MSRPGIHSWTDFGREAAAEMSRPAKPVPLTCDELRELAAIVANTPELEARGTLLGLLVPLVEAEKARRARFVVEVDADPALVQLVADGEAILGPMPRA
jgi:hypothetical protein